MSLQAEIKCVAHVARDANDDRKDGYDDEWPEGLSVH